MADRGSAGLLALSLLLGGTLLVGLASDVARLVAGWRHASEIAHRSAETGAGWVTTDALYEGRLEVDVARAESAAQRVISTSGLRGFAEASPIRVCATVGAVVDPGLIGLLGAGSHRVDVTACAEPRQG